MLTALIKIAPFGPEQKVKGSPVTEATGLKNGESSGTMKKAAPLQPVVTLNALSE